jgi:regulator of protease activity HflC (stomatin/prohibitin superfamily)
MEALIAVLLIVLIALVLLRPAISIVTVYDYQRGLRYRGGRLIGLVAPGPHASVKPYNEIQVIDARPTNLTVPGQEILTADGVALKVSLTARYVVADPVAAVTNDQSYVTALYVALHGALRDAVAGRTADDILAARADLGHEIGAAVATELARIGVELLAVDLRDVMVPSELKRAFAGIVAARREGEAALERARGETAALRSLANAGRMVKDNPGLFQLRVLQQLGGSSGNTIMLGVGADGRAPGMPPPPPRSRSTSVRDVGDAAETASPQASPAPSPGGVRRVARPPVEG